MIIIEVTESPNPYLLGLHKNYGNIYIVGRSQRSNLRLSNIEDFKISVENDKLYIENIKAGVFYILNGKKISGKKSIQLNDKFSFKDLTFKVNQFQYSHIDPITDTENLYKERIKERPSLEEIFNLIEQEFIHLEKIKYHAN